jgi:hypothetical protein
MTEKQRNCRTNPWDFFPHLNIVNECHFVLHLHDLTLIYLFIYLFIVLHLLLNICEGRVPSGDLPIPRIQPQGMGMGNGD